MGVQAIPTSFAVARVPTRRHFLVVRCGEKLSQAIAMRTSGGQRLRRQRQDSRNRVRFLTCLMWP